MFLTEYKSKLSCKLSGKMYDPTKEEKLRQLHEPLLHDYHLTNEQLFEELKGYFIYLVIPNSKKKYGGFLATEDKIIIPKVKPEYAFQFTAKIQNPLSGNFDDYHFDVEEDDFNISKVTIAKVNTSIRKRLYLQVNKN